MTHPTSEVDVDPVVETNNRVCDVYCGVTSRLTAVAAMPPSSTPVTSIHHNALNALTTSRSSMARPSSSFGPDYRESENRTISAQKRAHRHSAPNSLRLAR